MISILESLIVSVALLLGMIAPILLVISIGMGGLALVACICLALSFAILGLWIVWTA